ncbi:MAG: hypothetical protein H6971_00730 [Gammaproteobacteria bacterium]|nr:hypothetical protein [Gammaproteobacteria bacterium]
MALGVVAADTAGGQDERADVAAALDYLRDQGKTVLDLAGYSFGAWVSAQVEWDGGLQRMILVSPPVGFAEFRDFPNLPELKGY